MSSKYTGLPIDFAGQIVTFFLNVLKTRIDAQLEPFGVLPEAMHGDNGFHVSEPING